MVSASRTSYVLQLFLLLFTGTEQQWNSSADWALLKSFLDTVQRISPVPEYLLDDSYPSTPDLLYELGYKSEAHTITTEDGYIITIFRIVGNRVTKRKPIIVTQGATASSDFVIAPGNNSIPIHLANAGYDVWLGNFRGSNYGRAHIKLDPDRKKFWDFTFHELGYYDIPAMMDHVISVTGSKSVSYVSHSGGTTLFLVMAASRPEYDAKISVSILLGPISGPPRFTQNTILQHIGQNFNLYGELKRRRLHEFERSWRRSRRFLRQLCLSPLTHILCRANLIFIAAGDILHWNFPHAIDITSLGTVSTATKAIEHYRQFLTYARLAHFDYGQEKNLKLYGSEHPPLYNLSNIKAPVACFFGKNDFHADLPTFSRLAKEMPNLIMLKEIDDPRYNHIDFFFADNMKEVLMDDMIKILDHYDNIERVK